MKPEEVRKLVTAMQAAGFEIMKIDASPSLSEKYRTGHVIEISVTRAAEKKA
jgi:hypothetical protein